jgi:hypothetical protein
VYPSCGLVFGSADPVAAEAMALAVLRDARQSLPFSARAPERIALAGNPLYKRVNTLPVPENPAIRHAMTLGLGGIGDARNIDGTVPEEYLRRLTSLVAGKAA